MSSHDDSHRDHSHEDEHSHNVGHSHGAQEHGEKRQHGQPHGHDHSGGALGHRHGPIDPTILTTSRGIWAVKWSFIGLMATTLIQVVIVYYSRSVALLADTIHNLGDACTAVPLAIAFLMARRNPSKRFTYGYGRVEDLAGVLVVLTILASAVAAGYESIQRFLHPRPVGYLWAVVVAAIVGFLGNEGVAIFRIKVGKEMGSAALIADGYHARVDGFTSLAVLFSAVGVWLGYPLADPVIGVLITLLILRIVWDSGKEVFTRLLDGVDPDLVDKIKEQAKHAEGVEDVSELRVRWHGHRLQAELNLAVPQNLSVEEGHNVANRVRHNLLHNLLFLSGVTIHVDPANASGEKHHHIEEHVHDGEAAHSH
jgi:cation diffusion facilitator family transporter